MAETKNQLECAAGDLIDGGEFCGVVIIAIGSDGKSVLAYSLGVDEDAQIATNAIADMVRAMQTEVN